MRTLFLIACLLFAQAASAEEYQSERSASQPSIDALLDELSSLYPEEADLGGPSLNAAAAQQYLFNLGYPITAIDGLIGKETAAAIGRFQEQQMDLSPLMLGQLTSETLQLLSKMNHDVEELQYEGSLVWGAVSSRSTQSQKCTMHPHE